MHVMLIETQVKVPATHAMRASCMDSLLGSNFNSAASCAVEPLRATDVNPHWWKGRASPHMGAGISGLTDLPRTLNKAARGFGRPLRPPSHCGAGGPRGHVHALSGPQHHLGVS